MPTVIANSTFPPIPDNVVVLTGPRIVGYLLHWGLFGVLCVQVYLYYCAFPNDTWRIKALVYTTFLVEIAQTLILTNTAFNVFARGYGNLTVFTDVQAAWFEVPIMTGVVAFFAQAFYAYRLRILSQSNVTAIVILFLSVLQLGGAIADGVVVKHLGNLAHLSGRDYTITASFWNGASALCDIIIAVFMTYYLSRARSGGLRSTNILLKKVIILVIETGTVTAVIGILNLILATLPGQLSYYLVTSETIAKIYSNSMMVVLNSRMRIGLDTSTSEGTTTTTTFGRPRNGGTSTFGFDTGAYEMGAEVTITREEAIFPSASDRKIAFGTGSKGYLV